MKYSDALSARARARSPVTSRCPSSRRAAHAASCAGRSAAPASSSTKARSVARASAATSLELSAVTTTESARSVSGAAAVAWAGSTVTLVGSTFAAKATAVTLRRLASSGTFVAPATAYSLPALAAATGARSMSAEGEGAAATSATVQLEEPSVAGAMSHRSISCTSSRGSVYGANHRCSAPTTQPLLFPLPVPKRRVERRTNVARSKSIARSPSPVSAPWPVPAPPPPSTTLYAGTRARAVDFAITALASPLKSPAAKIVSEPTTVARCPLPTSGTCPTLSDPEYASCAPSHRGFQSALIDCGHDAGGKGGRAQRSALPGRTSTPCSPANTVWPLEEHLKLQFPS